MNGTHQRKAPPSSSDPLTDLLNGRSTRNNSHQHRHPPPFFHPTFQKVLLLLIAVVFFDVVFVYQAFQDGSSNSTEHASAEVGVVNMKSNRMDGLADHVITKLKQERGDAQAISNNGEQKRKKAEPSWKTDRRMNPGYEPQHGVQSQTLKKRHKAEPSWKTDRRMNPDMASNVNNNNGYHVDLDQDHVGLISGQFDSLDTQDKWQELQLEVQLWKGRYEMTLNKLHRLEEATNNNNNGDTSTDNGSSSHNNPLQPHEAHALLYQGIDTEGKHDDSTHELYDPYKTDVFTKSEETYGVDPHILNILHAADVEIDEELAAVLPTWEDIVGMYGDRPIISGLETCEAYREQVKPEDRMTGPAGMFNTGTNLLFELLKTNCDIKEARLKPRREPKHNGMRWQAPVSTYIVDVFVWNATIDAIDLF